VEEKYKKLAEHLLGNVFIADNEEALQNSNGFVVIEKNGKYVKGKYSLTGGSVGLFEGKRIGRVKNLEKLLEEISSQNYVVEKLKGEIQARHNEVIAFNEDLRESAISDTEFEIQQLTNQVFSLHNKLENLHAMQNQGQHRIEELNLQLQQTQGSVQGVRIDLNHLNEELQLNANRLKDAEETFKSEENNYNEANNQYNEFNLQVTKQQSKINALKQELEFKNNQLKDLQVQIETNTASLSETAENILNSEELLKKTEESLVGLMKTKRK
jgi:chromosome segregation protein